LVLTTDGEPVAVVTRPSLARWPSEPGTAKGRSFWMAPDFDAPPPPGANGLPHQ
jgi:hypothetical protein